MLPAADHIYLVGALMSVAVFLVVVALEPRRRHILLASAVLAAPAGLLDSLFVPAYWQPLHVVGRELSIEGMLFSFAVGGLAVWCAIQRRSIGATVGWSGHMLRTYLLAGALAMAVLASGLIAGLSIMEAGLLAMAATTVACLVVRPDAWSLAMRGAVSFGALYAAFILGLALLWPAVTAFWTGHSWGIRLMGIPLEEFVWAALYGALWPLVMAVVLGLAWRSEPSLPRRRSDLPEDLAPPLALATTIRSTTGADRR